MFLNFEQKMSLVFL